MTDTQPNDRIAGYKTQAKRLRAQLADTGAPISHSQALEMIARQHGARDWNTLRAMAAVPGNARPLAVGDRVSGRYLGQPFTGYVHGLTHAPQAAYSRITLHFDDPVDVVSFDSFSSFRQRVSATIDADGRSPQKTSDGQPQLVVVPAGL
ncbi:hypothetical protein LCL97_22575 [Seohaeicola saemankumensis]|nr:glyoxalase superfamily protein [Seohaeicola saemankumensis]MCA0873628.1 hypothetical protein [Seohaeicola saemankumensis]